MTKYREIIRLAGLGLSQTNIALSCNASKTTVNKVLKAAREQNLTWPLDPKTNRSSPLWIAFPEPESQSHYIQADARLCPHPQGTSPQRSKQEAPLDRIP